MCVCVISHVEMRQLRLREEIARTGILTLVLDTKAHAGVVFVVVVFVVGFLVLFCFTLFYVNSLEKVPRRKKKKRAVLMIVQVFIKHLVCAQHCSLPCVARPCNKTWWGEGVCGV